MSASNIFNNESLAYERLVWYLTKITALFFTLLGRFLGARKAAVLVSTNLTSPLRSTYYYNLMMRVLLMSASKIFNNEGLAYERL